MVDEGLFTSLDWHEQSLKYKPLPRTLGILWILSERLRNEGRKLYDDDTDTSEMEEDKEALNTENESLE